MRKISNSDLLAFGSLSICACLILFRFFYFHPADWRLLFSFSFIRSGNTLFFFGWNLFLAALPYCFIRLSQHTRNNTLRFLLGGLWLLFLPNAPYLLSDIIHLRPRSPVPYWYDLLTFTSCITTGLLLGGLAVLVAARQFRWQLWSTTAKWLALSVFPLCGFGIYLGRVLRWNSWDLLAQPVDLFQDISFILTNKVAMLAVCRYSFGYGIVLLVVTAFVNHYCKWEMVK